MDTIFGLPLHPLVVHFVVVAVPATALVGIVISVWPRARAYLGWFPPLLGLVTLISVPVATTSGAALDDALGNPDFLARHASLGDSLILAVGPLFGALLLQWLVHLPRIAAMIDDDPAGRRLTWLRAVAALAVIAAAIASLVLVALVGDSGARAVWGAIPVHGTEVC